MPTLTHKNASKSCAETKVPCPVCESSQPARNHYFTGKLLVTRDFEQEQDFFLSKHRGHNRVLHGWGAACGLRVVQHPNPECRDRYVVVQPGTAVDCCGRVIDVERDELFDFRDAFLDKWREAQEAAGEPPADDATPEGEHTFQICLRYRECPAELIPALFDECGCNDDRTEPNRILESFSLDLVLNPEISPPEPAGIELDWSSTLNIAGAAQIAIDPSQHRLYVLSTESSATLWALDVETQALLDARSFTDQHALDVAVSPTGDRIYVVVEDETGTDDPEILALDAADIGAAPIDSAVLTGARDGGVRLETAPDGRVIVLDPQNQQISVFDAHLVPVEDAGGLNAPVDLAIAPDGEWIYVADPAAGEVAALRLDDLTIRESIQPQPGIQPLRVAVASQDSADVLAILDGSANQLLLARFDDDSPPVTALGQPVTALAQTPLDVALSPAGRWAYVLSRDASDQGRLQVIDVNRVELDQEGAIGSPLNLATFVRVLESSPNGQRLYIPYSNEDDDDFGGVLVIEVSETGCCDVLGLRDCPDCSDDGECVVLATIEGYEFGEQVVDMPVDDDDLGDDQAAINNRLGRRILASTQAIQQAVECLCEQRIGARGEQGPPGPAGQDGLDGDPGQDGAGIDEVDVEYIDCDQTPEPPEITEDENGVRTLHLQIPSCCERDLVHLCGINWDHNRYLPEFPRLPNGELGLAIAFDGDVQSEDFASGVAVRVSVLWPEREPVIRLCACYLVGRALPAQLNLQPSPAGGCEIVSIEELGAGPAANGAVWQSEMLSPLLDTDRDLLFRVEVMGDFIRDADGRSVDLEHVAPWIPNDHTGEGKRGGRFESWFRVSRQPQPPDLFRLQNLI